MSVLPGSPHEPGFVAETLAWCNERRAEKGLEPLDRLPKGNRNDALSCPCGAATQLYVYSNYYASSISGNIGKLPACVTSFVDSFDRCELPQYDAEAVSA